MLICIKLSMLLCLLKRDLICFKNQKTRKWKRYPYVKDIRVSVCVKRLKRDQTCDLDKSCQLTFEFDLRMNHNTVYLIMSLTEKKFIYNGNQDGKI